MANRFKPGDIVLCGTKKAKVVEFFTFRGGEYLITMLEGRYKGKSIPVKPELLKPVI